MTPNKDDKTKIPDNTLENKVSKKPLWTVHDFRSAEEIERERRKKEWGWFFKWISSLVEWVLWTKEDKQEQVLKEQSEKINEKRRMRQLMSETIDAISYKTDENSNKYLTKINLICKKIQSSWKLSNEVFEYFNKITKVIFTKPWVIDTETRQKWQKIIQSITNAWLISQKEKDDLFWAWRLLQIYYTIKWKVEDDLDYLHNQIKIPTEKLNNIISEEIYKSIDDNFSFWEDSDRTTISKEELLEKGKTTIITAIKNIKEALVQLLTGRLPWDYSEYKTELDSDSISKIAAQWWYIYYWSSLLWWQKGSEKTDNWFVNSKGPSTRIENCAKYVYVFISPTKAKKILQETINMSLFRWSFNKNSGNILSDFDWWWHIIKVVEFIDANIESLFLNWIPNNIVNSSDKWERFSETCSNLIYNYQRLKCELMSWDSVLETLWKIITIYEQNDRDNEIGTIFWIFEKIRLLDITKLREIIRDYNEIVQPKMVKMDWKDWINSLSFSELIKIWSFDKEHKKYRWLLMDKIRPITFIWEVWNRLHWSSLINWDSTRPDDIIVSRIKKKVQKDWLEILWWDIIKVAISPDKNHFAVLLNETSKDWWNKSSYNIHIINLKTLFVERSYNSVVSTKWNNYRAHREFDLNFLSDISSNSEYNIYLSDWSNFYLLWLVNDDGSYNKKMFQDSDSAISWNKDKWVDVTEWRDIIVSKIDNQWRYLFRFHNLSSRISDGISNSYRDKPYYWNLKDIPAKQSEIRTYLSIIWLEGSHVLLNWEKKTHVFPLTLKEDYLMPFLQQDNSLFISNDWQYLFILFESEKNWNKIFKYQVINNNWEIELLNEEINYSELWIDGKIKQIKFTKDNRKAFILQHEWDITVYDIINKKVLLKIKATFIKKAISKSPDFKILRIALDPVWEYVSIYIKEDWKPQIVLLSLKTGKIAPLNLEGKNKSSKWSLEWCTISPIWNNIKLIYNSKWTIFKLEFKWTINKEVDITNIFNKIKEYDIKKNAVKNMIWRKNIERYDELFSGKIWNSTLKINYDHVTKVMQYSSFWNNQWWTFNLGFILWEIGKAAKNNNWITHLCFSKDWWELLYWTTDWQYCIYSRTKFIKLFEIEKQEQQTS